MAIHKIKNTQSKNVEMSSLFDNMFVPRSCSSVYSAHRAWEEDSPTASNDLGAGIASSLKRKKEKYFKYVLNDISFCYQNLYML